MKICTISYVITLMIVCKVGFCIDLTVTKQNTIKQTILNQLPNELEGEPTEFAEGFIEGLVESGDVGISWETIEPIIPHYSLRTVKYGSGQVNRAAGKLGAFQMLRNIKIREKLGSPILSKEEAEPAQKRLDDLKGQIELLIDKYSHKLDQLKEASPEFDPNVVIDRVKSKLGVVVERDKHAMIDPSYITAPSDVNLENSLKVLSDLEEVLMAFTGEGTTITEIIKKYPGIRSIDQRLPREIVFLQYFNQIPDLYRIISTKYFKPIINNPQELELNENVKRLESEINTLSQELNDNINKSNRNKLEN